MKYNNYREIINKYKEMENTESRLSFFRDGEYNAMLLCQERDTTQVIFYSKKEPACSDENFYAKKSEFADNINAYNAAVKEVKDSHPEWFTTRVVAKTIKTPEDVAEDVKNLREMLKEKALLEIYLVWQELKEEFEKIKAFIIDKPEYKTERKEILPEFKEEYSAKLAELKTIHNFMSDSEIKKLAGNDTMKFKYRIKKKIDLEEIEKLSVKG